MQQKLNLLKEPDFSTKRDAFQFQQQAVNTLKDLEYGAIFHEQGLGKTKIAIDAETKPATSRHQLLWQLRRTESP